MNVKKEKENKVGKVAIKIMINGSKVCSDCSYAREIQVGTKICTKAWLEIWILFIDNGVHT